MNRIIENNQVTISGEITSDFAYSHELYGEKFYMVDLKVKRLSESYDIVPLMVSDRLLDTSNTCVGLGVKATGQFRSYNKQEEIKNRLVLTVFVTDVEFVNDLEEANHENEIYLDGYICKEPIYRKTPLGREITDLLIAVNRPYGKSDYIPCICWGRNARYASTLSVGEHCAVWGRIQSREYTKNLGDGTTEQRVAYEVSISKVEVLEDEE